MQFQDLKIIESLDLLIKPLILLLLIKFIQMFLDMFLEIRWFFQTYPLLGHLNKKIGW